MVDVGSEPTFGITFWSITLAYGYIKLLLPLKSGFSLCSIGAY